MQSPSPYQLKFLSYAIRDDIVYYSIQVVNINQKLSWQFDERYKNMLQLHEQVSKLSKTVPQFPPKKLFGNRDPEFIQSRKAALQNYFKILLQHVNVDEINPLKNFLARGQPKQIRDSTIDKPAPNMDFQKPEMKQNLSQKPKPNFKTEYEKIQNQTNQKFIDLGFTINPPEDNEIKKKKYIYEQVKIESLPDKRGPIPSNPEAHILVSNQTLDVVDQNLFQMFDSFQAEVKKILK